MKNKPFSIIALILIFTIAFLVRFSQNYPLYVELTPLANVKASKQLKSHFDSVKSEISITLFATQTLINELQLSSLKRWIQSLSKSIHVLQKDPFKHPGVADHYDITSDGIIVIEYNNKRLDIDLIELVLVNEEFSATSVQNHLLKSLVQLVRPILAPIILIHNHPTSLFEDQQPLGLSSLSTMVNDFHIPIEERQLNEYITMPPDHSMLILYNLGPSIQLFSNELQGIIANTNRFIIFSHPKHASFMNHLVKNIQFYDEIIEDPSMHILNQPNQLLVEYLTQTNDQLFGVFPFSSYVQSTLPEFYEPFILTSDSAKLVNPINKEYIPPYALAYKSKIINKSSLIII